MIEKQEFYHGAAILRIVEDPRCASLIKDSFGYVVNSDIFVYVKYSTKNRSPWGFSVTEDEVRELGKLATQASAVIMGFVCGGDGICGVRWPELMKLLGDTTGWISISRGFGGRYSVSGPITDLQRKVPINAWPCMIFEGGKSNGESE